MVYTKKISNRRVVACAAVSALLFFAVAAIASSRRISGVELEVFRAINDWPQSFHVVFLIVTQAGSEWMLFGLTLLLLGLKKNRLALRVFLGGAAAFLLSQFAKLLVDRPRPFYVLDSVQLREFMRIDNGFPSSHVAVATACSFIVMLVLPKRWRWLGWVWIAMVGLSRVYLGVHAPLDVVGGFAIGMFVVSVSLLLHGKLKAVLKITHTKLQR